MTGNMDVDSALNSIGRFGKWQAIFYNIVSIFATFTGAWQMFAINFIGADEEHHCRLPNGTDVNKSIPFITEKGITKRSSCLVYANYSSETNITEKCPNGYQFKEGQGRYTISHEWDLVCDKAYLVGTTQTFVMIGVMIGSMVCCTLADIFGRKQVWVASMIGTAILGVSSAFVHNIYAFIVLRFLVGILQPGYMLVGFVLACEMFPAQVRTEAGMIFMTWWAVGMCIMSLIAYFLRSWHNLLITLSATGFISIIFIWILPQSVPWLVAQGRELEAKLILKDIAKFNGKPLPEKFQLTAEDEVKLDKAKKKKGKGAKNKHSGQELVDVDNVKGDSKDEEEHEPMPSWMRRASVKIVEPFESKPKDGEEHKYTILDILRSPTLRIYIVILSYLFLVNTLVYYGLSLSTGNLAGDIYINFFLSGLVEIPANIVAMFALKYIGRRMPICIFHFIAGVPLILSLAIPHKTASGMNLVPLIVTLSMIGKFGITASFDCMFLWGTELFPTTIRNAGLGISTVLSKIGSMLAPFSVIVAKSIWWFPSVLFGTMCLLGGMACLILPETRNKPLPQTIEEVENTRRQQRKCCPRF